MVNRHAGRPVLPAVSIAQSTGFPSRKQQQTVLVRNPGRISTLCNGHPRKRTGRAGAAGKTPIFPIPSATAPDCEKPCRTMPGTGWTLRWIRLAVSANGGASPAGPSEKPEWPSALRKRFRHDNLLPPRQRRESDQSEFRSLPPLVRLYCFLNHSERFKIYCGHSGVSLPQGRAEARPGRAPRGGTRFCASAAEMANATMDGVHSISEIALCSVCFPEAVRKSFQSLEKYFQSLENLRLAGGRADSCRFVPGFAEVEAFSEGPSRSLPRPAQRSTRDAP